jgi:aspartate beta-hydroxylase
MSRKAVAAATLSRSGLLRTTRSAQRQAPSLFFLPGLAAKPLWDAKQFKWLPELERLRPEIVREYVALREAKVASDYGAEDHKLHEGAWQWHSLVTKGSARGDVASRCPATSSALFGCVGEDLVTGGVPFAYAFFSTLESGAAIAPHYGPTNLRLRVHMPLLIDEPDAPHDRLGMRVAGKDVRWRLGEPPIVFDDAFEHEAWNRTSGERVVLLFDVWHPDIAPDERASIVEMFAEARRQQWLK